MIDELADRIWINPKFQEAALAIQTAWLNKELQLDQTQFGSAEATRLISASATLAASSNLEHRRVAFRIAACAVDLFETTDLPVAQALRVVLSRSGNLPSIATYESVDRALEDLPWPLVVEELAVRDSREVIVNDRKLYLTNFQWALWNRLRNSTKIALAAPTSAGKSFVLETYLSSLVAPNLPCAIVYIVPTRALITQVSGDIAGALSKRFDRPPVDIVTVPIMDGKLPDQGIYVMTQERIQLLLNAHNEFSSGVIIIDEAHSIADGDRGILLQWVIDELLKRNPASQILFASPSVRNLDIFGRLFGIDVYPAVSDERTVEQNFIVTTTVRAIDGHLEIGSAGDGTREPFLLGARVIGHTLASRIDKLVHIPVSFGRGRSNIIYANGAAEAEDIALKISDLVPPQPVSAHCEALAKLAAESVHENYVMVDCIKKGIAFHYANIPTILRRAVEQAFSTGGLTDLICTSTLLQGVNLPAKNIFMCAPEKGNGNYLSSTDFWNLAGRAGRLLREFQGNIFLIDYDKWKRKPLSGPRDDIIVPAIEMHITANLDSLIRVIEDDRLMPGHRDRVGLESAFVRLLTDMKTGDLINTLKRAGLDLASSNAQRLAVALQRANSRISLPPEIIRLSANISAHRQQKLFIELTTTISNGGIRAARSLLPAHPRETEEAFESYSQILALCQRIILDRDPSKNLHRFHALIGYRWMRGWSLPRIIDSQIRYKPDQPIRRTIRNTLEVIENQIRFQAVRLFGCYNILLKHALGTAGLEQLAEKLVPVPLFLEIGASDLTMISFIELGLSRVASAKLNDLAPSKNLSQSDALAWLRSRRIESFELSTLLEEEVRLLLSTSDQ